MKKNTIVFIAILITLVLFVSCESTSDLFSQNYDYTSTSSNYYNKKINPTDKIMIFSFFNDYAEDRYFELEIKKQLEEKGFTNVAVSTDYSSSDDAYLAFANQEYDYSLMISYNDYKVYEYGGGVSRISIEAMINEYSLFGHKTVIKMGVTSYAKSNNGENYSKTVNKAFSKLAEGIVFELSKSI